MEKPEFENFTNILNNFDAFCNEFEGRAAEAYMRGDNNSGKVVRAATEKLGGETPSVVTEVREFRAEDISVGETDDSV
jgi:hypothetical protein